MYRLVSLLGFGVLLAIAWLLSEDRRRIHWRVLAWGCALQWLLALLVLRVRAGRWVFERLGDAVGALVSASDAGAGFLFGDLVKNYMAFSVLPIVIFVSALSALLYHWGIVQMVIRGLAWLMQRTMRVSGLEALGSALFIFFGIETVTGIRAYMEKSTRSETFTLMTAFMATIAGSVMGAYVKIGVPAEHLLAASLMSAPAAIVVAKLMLPETETPLTAGAVKYEPAIESMNSVDALSRGAAAGLTLALGIGACLIAFVGTVALVNHVLRITLGASLEALLGYALSPLAALLGVPGEDVLLCGQLLGIKTAVNEWVAYERMTALAAAGCLSARTQLICTYALCGFANFGSIAILVGGMSVLAPERRSQFAALGVKALVSGTLAAFLTACVAGTLG